MMMHTHTTRAKRLTALLRFHTIALGLIAIFSAGCLFVDTHPDAGKKGYTECGDFIEETYCQPGQYCEDPTFSDCKEGCLSGENCASDQICIKSNGAHIGSCQNKGKQSPAPSGVTACGERGDEQRFCQPGQYCESTTFGRCENGCLSNGNCAPDQVCVKQANENVGTCQNSE